MLALKSTLLSQAGAKRIETGNPITKGLIFARIGPDAAYGSSGPIGVAPSCSRVIDTSGVSIQIDPGGGWHRANLKSPITSSEWSLFFLGASTSTDGYNVAWGLTEPSDTNRIHQHYRIFDSGRYGADCRPYKSDYNSAVYTFPTNATNAAVGVTISGVANSIRLYANGRQTDSTTLDDTSAVTISEAEFFSKNNGGDAAADGSRLSLCLAWSRALTAEEMLSLYANPWQVFG
jgi:hypothetical protein